MFRLCLCLSGVWALASMGGGSHASAWGSELKNISDQNSISRHEPFSFSSQKTRSRVLRSEKKNQKDELKENKKQNLLPVSQEAELDLELRKKNQAYFEKENHRTAGIDDEKQYHDYMTGVSKSMTRKVLVYQLMENMKRAEQNSPEFRQVRQFHILAGSFAKGEQAIVNSGGGGNPQGKDAVTPLGPVEPDQESWLSVLRFRMGTHTNLPHQSIGLWIRSAIVNIRYDTTVGRPWGFDPWTFETFNRNEFERQRVGVDREIPVLDLTGSAWYGSTSGTFNASLSKNITENLSCSIASKQDLRQYPQPFAGKAEEVLSVSYGTNF